MSDIRFDGKVAIVTGAGGGLGRTYALLLAARGAKVVVNDLGTSMTGAGKASKAADAVVAEIRAAGGEAVANYDSVEDGQAIVDTAVGAFGTVHIVINNAGILRDVSFSRMKDGDWDIIQRVHLTGAYSVTKAAWPLMRANEYGRVIMTSSAAGLYGNFGQANYSAAKLGLHGLAQTLAREGASKNIVVNTIAPIAGSRLTETVLPPDLVAALRPDFVAPLVAYLVSDECADSGRVFELGAGWMSTVRWQRSPGHTFPHGDAPPTVEQVRDAWASITDFDADGVEYPTSPQDAFSHIMGNIKDDAAAEDDGVFASAVESYTERDAILYALGVGAGRGELPLVYEMHEDFAVLPTFAVTFQHSLMAGLITGKGIPGLPAFNPMMLLHGEQRLQMVAERMPTACKVKSSCRVKHMYDKGSGALVVLEITSADVASGDVLCINEASLFIRGIGGFGGERGPAKQPGDGQMPTRSADKVAQIKLSDDQALLYRLAGDTNPLHADPSMAALGGFDKPILHGLCTFGAAGRAIVANFAGNEPARLREIRARFTKHVFPGETLRVHMWALSATEIAFQVTVAERADVVVVSGGRATLSPRAKL